MAALGWTDLARSILAFMNGQRDPETGGYPSRIGVAWTEERIERLSSTLG